MSPTKHTSYQSQLHPISWSLAVMAYMETVLNIMQKTHSFRETALNTTQKAQVFTFGENALKLVFVYENSVYLGQKLGFISLLHDFVQNRFVKIKCSVGCDMVRSIVYQSKDVYIPYYLKNLTFCVVCYYVCAYLITLIFPPHHSF